jgi:hypothetical protein
MRGVHGALAITAVQETLGRVEAIQNVASAAIITVAGWLILQSDLRRRLSGVLCRLAVGLQRRRWSDALRARHRPASGALGRPLIGVLRS